MLLPEGFQHHIFISYGWSGNLRPDEGDRGWAAELRNRLVLALRTEFGSSPEIFLDTEMSRSGALKPSLEKVLESTALLLFVVSPGSCQSAWCGWEVQRFLDTAWSPASRNDTLLPDDRIVGVTLQEVSRPQLPQALQSLDLRAYDLRHAMPGSGVQRPVVWEEIEQQSPARDEFPALVSELAKRLKALQMVEQARVQPSGLSIFVGTAPSRHHEEQQLNPLRRDLLMRGHRVFSWTHVASESEEEYRLSLESRVAVADLAVYVIGAANPTPENWKQSPLSWQLRRAFERAGLPVFTRVDPDAGEPDRLALELLQKGDQRHEKLPFNNLRKAILDRTDEMMLERVQGVFQGAGKRVVIAFCEEDSEKIAAIKKNLEGQQLISELALPPGKRQKKRDEINFGKFQEANGVLVYFGVDDLWMSTTCKAVRQAFQNQPGKHSALALGQPKNRPKWKALHTEPGFERFDPDDASELEHWAKRVQRNG